MQWLVKMHNRMCLEAVLRKVRRIARCFWSRQSICLTCCSPFTLVHHFRSQASSLDAHDLTTHRRLTLLHFCPIPARFLLDSCPAPAQLLPDLHAA